MHFVTQNPFFKSGDIFLKNWFVWRAPDGYQHSYSDPYIDEKVELWKQQFRFDWFVDAHTGHNEKTSISQRIRFDKNIFFEYCALRGFNIIYSI